jgi:hypothetical protein
VEYSEDRAEALSISSFSQIEVSVLRLEDADNWFDLKACCSSNFAFECRSVNMQMGLQPPHCAFLAVTERSGTRSKCSI